MSGSIRRIIGAFLLLLVLVPAGCRIRRKKVPGAEVLLPVPETAVQQEKPPAPPARAAELPPPPEIRPAAPAPGVAPVTETDTVPAPPPKPKRVRPKAAREEKETAEEQALPAEPAPAKPRIPPRLTQLLTDEERWAYSKEIDDGLVRVHQILKKVEGRPLTEEQTLVLNRVRAFLRQVAETRKSDLVTARNLLQRAELLAADLERTSR